MPIPFRDDGASPPDFQNVEEATGPRPREPVVQDEWEKLPRASWTPKGGQTIYFPVEAIDEDGGNRLVFRARPYRWGVKIDSTGGKEKTWVFAGFFSNKANAFDEEFNQEIYPSVLNALIDSFDIQETGDLVIPTRGRKRCRASTYKRSEKFDERLGAQCSFTFVEDNEDSVDAASVTRTTVKGSSAIVAAAAQFDAQSIGMWNGSIGELLDRINELKGILTLPGTFLDDVRSTIAVLSANIRDLITTFSDETTDGRNFFTDPESSRLRRKLENLLDTIAGSQYESNANTQPKTTQVSYEIDYSIFDIAALVGQDANKLLALNQYRIQDPMLIEAGSVILIYA